MNLKNILTVDDDHDFLMQLGVILKAGGYSVAQACNRKDAENMLRLNRPDAVIVDLMMEENDDGFALCYMARKLYPDMPIILVTGVTSETGIEFDSATDEERSWIKADVVLAKPVRSEQILGELKKLFKE